MLFFWELAQKKETSHAPRGFTGYLQGVTAFRGQRTGALKTAVSGTREVGTPS